MLILFLLAAGAAFVVFACCRVSSRCAREEERPKVEKISPCDRCLRWSECNGVDEFCPLKEGTQNGEN